MLQTASAALLYSIFMLIYKGIIRKTHLSQKNRLLCHGRRYYQQRSLSPVGGLKGSSLVKTIGDNETSTKENKRLFSVILVYWGKK